MRCSTTAARNGTVHSATTRIIDTVRNLSYIGKPSKNSRVSPMKWCPHDSMTASSVTAATHHLDRPRSTNMPSTASRIATAPRYTGPDVNGWGPQ